MRHNPLADRARPAPLLINTTPIDGGLRDLQPLVFLAGASALMVGNYLTTLNQPLKQDLQMLKDLGLDPGWDKHGFSDQEENAAATGTEAAMACR